MMGTVLNLLFPPKCVLCGRILLKEETDLCHRCRMEAPLCKSCEEKRSFLDSWTAVWYYERDVRKSLHRFKFRRARHYAGPYGRILAMKLMQEYPEGFDILTWIPVSRLRKLHRGYDQAELLAQAVGRELGMKPVRTLKKIRNNPPQSGLQEKSRRKANVLGAYRAVNPDIIRDRRVLLLDDIMTTGATAGEAARVLLTAGAEQVHCGTVAAVRNHEYSR